MLSDGLIGALIGGGATVLVSAMTQIIVIRNLNKQHAHDAKQKAEDRKVVARREVYLKLIDDYREFDQFMDEFHRQSPYEIPRDTYNALRSTATKITLIAERETALLALLLIEKAAGALVDVDEESQDIRRESLKRGAVIARFDVAEAEWRAADEYIRRASQDPLQKESLGDLAADLVRKEQYKERLRKDVAAMFEKSDPLLDAFHAMVSEKMKMTRATYQQLVNAMRADVGVGPRVFPELEKQS